MNKDAVQHERGPRNSTLRRQMSLFMNKDSVTSDISTFQQELLLRSISMRPPLLPPPFVLDLSSRNSTMLDSTSAYIPPAITSPQIQNITMPSDAMVESICETAAQLLFMNIRWVKNLCAIHQICMADQLTLLEDSWCDLFIIGSAQHLIQFNFNPLLCAYEVMNNNRNNHERTALMISELNVFQNLLFKMAQLRIDEKEYECMRAITLYKSGKEVQPDSSRASNCESPSSSVEKSLQDQSKIFKLKEDAMKTLANHVNVTKSTQPLRYENLIVILEQLKDITSFTIEELFFRRTIGHVTIVKVILDMYSQGKV